MLKIPSPLLNPLHLSLISALLGLAPATALAADPPPTHYIDPSQVDLAHILAPPPEAGSAAAKADMKAVVDAQKTRTPAEIKTAQEWDKPSLFNNFGDILGPAFRTESLPLTTVFFSQANGDGIKVMAAAKNYFKRPRPYDIETTVQPVVDHKPGGSFPSGHALLAYEDAILLADIVPEKAPALFERAAAISHSRIVAGVHFPTDLDAGRISGSAIDDVLLHEPRFVADLEKARAEVRHALGLQ